MRQLDEMLPAQSSEIVKDQNHAIVGAVRATQCEGIHLQVPRVRHSIEPEFVIQNLRLRIEACHQSGDLMMPGGFKHCPSRCRQSEIEKRAGRPVRWSDADMPYLQENATECQYILPELEQDTVRTHSSYNNAAFLVTGSLP